MTAAAARKQKESTMDPDNTILFRRAPRLCDLVIFTASRGDGTASGVVDEYAGIVVGVKRASEGIVDLKTFGPNSLYSNHSVPYNEHGAAGTWRHADTSLGDVMVVSSATGNLIRIEKDGT